MGNSEQEKAIRDFISGLEQEDLEKAKAFFTDDAVWISNEGEFKGLQEIERYIKWMFNTLKNIKFSDDGIGIISEGDKSMFQHTYEGLYHGNTTLKIKGMCTYQFAGNKCKVHCTVSDRLDTADQASGAVSGLAVGAILKQIQKGL